MPYEVLVAEEFWKRLEKVGDRALGEGGQPDPLRCRQGLHLERAQVVPQEFRAHPEDPREVPQRDPRPLVEHLQPPQTPRSWTFHRAFALAVSGISASRSDISPAEPGLLEGVMTFGIGHGPTWGNPSYTDQGDECPMAASELLKRVEVNPKVMAGKPVIRGTRIPVELILDMLAEDVPTAEILKAYPDLTGEDIRAAVAYASASLRAEELRLTA